MGLHFEENTINAVIIIAPAIWAIDKAKHNNMNPVLVSFEIHNKSKCSSTMHNAAIEVLAVNHIFGVVVLVKGQALYPKGQRSGCYSPLSLF